MSKWNDISNQSTFRENRPSKIGPTFVGTITKTFVECTDLMIKTSAFLIDILELQVSIWKSIFILEMDKTNSQRLA